MTTYNNGSNNVGSGGLVAYTPVCGPTAALGVLQSVVALGAAGTVLTSNGATALPSMQTVGGGSSLVVQRVSTLTGAEASGTTGLPLDDTIPQNTEGDQFMSLAITPLNSSHILVIDITVFGADSAAASYEGFTAALFQDSTANALAAMTAATSQFAADTSTLTFRYIMTAGTTSATTFKVRAGDPTGTFTFNGTGGARLFGGVLASSMTITEYTT